MITYIVDTGGTGNYTSLSAAIAAIPSTLNDNYTIQCIATTGVIDNVTGAGLTCNKIPAGFSITFDFRVGYELRHYVTADYQYTLRIKSTGVVNITGDGNGLLTIWYDFGTYPVTQTNPHIFFESNASSASHIVEKVKIRVVAKSYPTIANYSGVCGCGTTAVTSFTVRNIQAWFEGRVTTGTSQLIFDAGTNTTNAYIYNNTFSGGDVTPRASWHYGNNIISNGGRWLASAGVSLGGNKSEDTSSPDVAGRGQVFSFYSLTSHNFNLKTYDVGAKNQGVDLTGQTNAPTTDMYGTIRPLGASWDAGAHETYASTITSIAATLLDGSIGNSITVSSFTNPLSSLTIKSNSFSLICTNLTSLGGGIYTFDIPSIHQIIVNTLGVPFSSFYWNEIEIEAYDGLTYAQYRITFSPASGYSVVDISDVIDTGNGSVFYGWTGTPARYDQIMCTSANNTIITADGLLTTDSIVNFYCFYFDQTDHYWKPFQITVTSGINTSSNIKSIFSSCISSVITKI